MTKRAKRSKHALAIGINEYGFGFQLTGCVNDVKLITETLKEEFEFPSSGIRLLLDESATRQAIKANVESLARETGPGDAVVVYYSGLATRSPHQSHANGTHAMIAPHDVTFAEPDRIPSNAISYDEIQGWIRSLTAVSDNVAFILDASNAGLLGGPATAPYVWLSACRGEEQAYDRVSEGVPHGAFTYILVQALLEAGPRSTYRDIFEVIGARLPALFPMQHPQIEGAADRVLFGVGRRPGTRFVPVAWRQEDQITLSAGAVHGMTVSSRWAVYPATVRQISDKATKVGLVEVTSVDAIESGARVLSEAQPEAIRPGTQALEEMHDFGEMRLVVTVNAPDDSVAQKEALSTLLAESELLRLANPNERPAITVHLIPPGQEAKEGDALAGLSSQVSEPTWVAVDEKSQLVTAPHPVRDSLAPYVLREDLQRMARFRNLLGLRNPNLNSQLFGKVVLTIKRQAESGGWAIPETDDAIGVPLLIHGDRIGFEITSHYSEPIYVTILDFDATGGFTQIYPAAGGSERLGPNGKAAIGFEESDELVVTLQDGFTLGEPDDAETPSGVETVKLFATTYPTDFTGLLLQEGVRGAVSSQGQETALWQLLDLALTGRGSRERRPVVLPPEQDWMTVERSFALRRGT